ncbi:MAG: chromate transporter [Alkalispirochaeta sp.]
MTAWGLFFRFFRIGLVTVGGGYAMVPIIEHEIAAGDNSLSQREITQNLLIAQSAPGPIAINTALLIGRSLAGARGAAAAAIGVALPAFVIILLIARSFQAILELPAATPIFGGIRAAVVILIGLAAWRLGFRSRSWFLAISAGIWFVLLAWFGVSPYAVVLLAVFTGIGREYLRHRFGRPS